MKKSATVLALKGGTKAVVSPAGSGNRFNGNELRYLREALRQNTLFYGFGSFVHRACQAMRRYTGVPYIVPCSSGTAAIHLGLVACGIGPGDEVICAPNTDAGTVIGILAEGAVPIFCDVENTLQPSPRTIRPVLNRRTRAVVVVHLAGYPAPVEAIVRLCSSHGIPVLEDCAQSWGTRLKGRLVGTFGLAGAFSTNDFKHISTGDGGFLVLHDETLYRRAANYADKHYDRLFDRSLYGAHFGMNYRMTELQGAVALAQLEKVRRVTAHYHRLGTLLERLLADLPAGRLIPRLPDSYATYWWTALLPDYRKLKCNREELLHALQAEGVPTSSYGKYDLIQKPLFQTRIMRPWLHGWKRRYPLVQPDGRSYRYDYAYVPNHKRLLDTAIMLSPFGEFRTTTHIREIAAGIRKVFTFFSRGS